MRNNIYKKLFFKTLVFKTLTLLAITISVTSISVIPNIVFANESQDSSSSNRFIVEEIKVDGLQRMELGTFFNMLPLQVGEELEVSRIPLIIRTLFAVESFDDIRLFRDGNKLLIDVIERPTILDITIDGNSDIKTEQIIEAMKGAGFAKGEIYNPSAIKNIIGGMQEQYFSHGKYSVQITSKILRRSRNRVIVEFEVKEGDPAKIESIKIVNNQLYPDEELLDQFELSTGGWLSIFTSDDQYAREKLSGDLETMRSYYLDRGYLKYNAVSTQVAISPDRKGIYITINVDEGDKFTISDIKFSGDLILKEKRLKQLMPLTKGDTYSAAAISFAEEQIKTNLGFFGYAFAKVTTRPEVKEGTSKVDLNIYVDPGMKVYVDRINFTGNETTNDEVLRRESRLMEGGALSTAQVERTKLRLQRLTYIEEVEVETPKTEDKEDRVNIDYQIKERSAGTVSGGLGYGSTYGLSVNANVSHNNFLGSGKNIGFAINKNKFSTSYTANYFDPYFTLDEVGLGGSLSYRTTDYSSINIAATLLDTIALNINTGYLIDEITRLNFGLGLETNDLEANGRLSDQISDFFFQSNQNVREDPFLSYNVAKFSFGISRNSLNRGIFPDRGVKQSFAISGAIPGSDIEFYKLDYNLDYYVPFSPGWSLLSRVKLSYGDGYGKNTQLPYFENFYASGISSVRGFERNTIGPKEIFRGMDGVNGSSAVDNLGTSTSIQFLGDNISVGRRSVGGNAKALASIELIFPVPFAEASNSVRTSFFIDVGNLWNTHYDVDRYDGLNFQPGNRHTELPDFSKAGNYRASTGISLQWLSPMGPLIISLSKTLKSYEGDERDGFAFNVGQTF